ncbi:hypothetical protein L1887_32900 [Cichorium endivia]|nr:hypothetical protein L1887_32900 [Cichorium endivia]
MVNDENACDQSNDLGMVSTPDSCTPNLNSVECPRVGSRRGHTRRQQVSTFGDDITNCPIRGRRRSLNYFVDAGSQSCVNSIGCGDSTCVPSRTVVDADGNGSHWRIGIVVMQTAHGHFVE